MPVIVAKAAGRVTPNAMRSSPLAITSLVMNSDAWLSEKSTLAASRSNSTQPWANAPIPPMAGVALEGSQSSRLANAHGSDHGAAVKVNNWGNTAGARAGPGELSYVLIAKILVALPSSRRIFRSPINACN
jgi:hypothetical protein